MAYPVGITHHPEWRERQRLPRSDLGPHGRYGWTPPGSHWGGTGPGTAARWGTAREGGIQRAETVIDRAWVRNQTRIPITPLEVSPGEGEFEAGPFRHDGPSALYRSAESVVSLSVE